MYHIVVYLKDELAKKICKTVDFNCKINLYVVTGGSNFNVPAYEI